MLMSFFLDSDLNSMFDFLQNTTGAINQQHDTNEKISMEELLDE